MADNDFNTIKPVNSLHNIAGLTPAERRRERRRRRQNPHAGLEEASEQVAGDLTDEDGNTNKLTGDDNDRHSIDYRA